MNTQLQTTTESQLAIPDDLSMRSMEMGMGQGDFSSFTPGDKLRYLAATCKSVGLNPLTLPIRIIKMDGREVMYATAECSSQLAYRDKVSVKKVAQSVDNDVLIITCVATTPDGRSYEDIGAISLLYPSTMSEWINGQRRNIPHPKAGKRLEGLDYANALKKCHTQASRRCVLRLCSLAIMDESEIESARVTVDSTVQTAIEESAASRAEILNAALTSGEKEKAVEAEVVNEPVATPEPAPLIPETKSPEPPPSEQPKRYPTPHSITPAPAAPSALPEDKLLKLEEAMNIFDDQAFPDFSLKNGCDWLRFKKKLEPGALIGTTKADAVEWIISNPARFHKTVDQWVKGGRQ